jgi:hypothetical protein
MAQGPDNGKVGLASYNSLIGLMRTTHPLNRAMRGTEHCARRGIGIAQMFMARFLQELKEVLSQSVFIGGRFVLRNEAMARASSALYRPGE